MQQVIGTASIYPDTPAITGGFFTRRLDISNHLFYLVLFLEEFCDDSPAENDDPECRKDVSDTCCNPD